MKKIVFYLAILFLFQFCASYEKRSYKIPNECFNIDNFNSEDLVFKFKKNIKENILNIKNDFKGYKIYYIFYNKKEKIYYLKIDDKYSYYCLKVNSNYQIIEEKLTIIDL